MAAFVWAYWPTFIDLAAAWQRDPDYAHGWLVVPLALAFIWLRSDDFPLQEIRMSWVGLTLIAASIGLRTAAIFFYLQPLDGWSIPLCLAGGVWLLGGIPLLRLCGPSIAFLVFMVPLPYRAAHLLSAPLQQVCTQVSCWILQCLGQPALAEGNIILLNSHQLEVARACSGLRILMGILAIAFAYLIVTRRSWWIKVLLLVSAAPIALLANSIRIVITGLLYDYVSEEVGKTFSHDLAGWVMIPLAVLMFASALFYLDRLLRDNQTIDMSEIVARNRL